MLWCVREAHSAGGQPLITLVVVRSDGDGQSGGGRFAVAGHEFHAAPRLKPDGRQHAWLCWSHPDMPWDDSPLKPRCKRCRSRPTTATSTSARAILQ